MVHSGAKIRAEAKAIVPIAIFVGGKSTRMGGFPKGLLPVDSQGTPLLHRLFRECSQVSSELFLVGCTDPYLSILPESAQVFEDCPQLQGPLAGFAVLAEHLRAAHVLVISCDLPHVKASTLRGLANHPSQAAVVSARPFGDVPWQPFLARYTREPLRRAMGHARVFGQSSVLRLFQAKDIHLVDVPCEEQHDWDSPQDIEKVEGHGARGAGVAVAGAGFEVTGPLGSVDAPEPQ